MCERFECVPLSMVKGNLYVTPKIHTQVYYPDGREPPPKPTSHRPSTSGKTKPSRSPRLSRSPSPKHKTNRPQYQFQPNGNPKPPNFPHGSSKLWPPPPHPDPKKKKPAHVDQGDSSGFKFVPIKDPLVSIEKERQKDQENQQ